MALTVLTNHVAGRALSEQISAWVRREYLGVTPVEPVPLALKGARREFLQSQDGRRWLRLSMRLHERQVESVPGDQT